MAEGKIFMVKDGSQSQNQLVDVVLRKADKGDII